MFSALCSHDQIRSCFLHCKSALCSSDCFPLLLLTQTSTGVEHVSFKALQQHPSSTSVRQWSSSFLLSVLRDSSKKEASPSASLLIKGHPQFFSSFVRCWEQLLCDGAEDHTGPRFASFWQQGALFCRMGLGNPKLKLCAVYWQSLCRVLSSPNK